MKIDSCKARKHVLWTALVACLVGAGCATVLDSGQQTTSRHPPQPRPPASEDGTFEEITIAGSGRQSSASPAGRVPATVASAWITVAEDLAARPPADELWIIARPDVAAGADDTPGSGAMVAHFPGGDGEPVEVPLPLRHTEVDAVIDGYLSTVDVRQQFHNPFDEKIEAVYLFPLPEKSAVSEFVMTIGERRIRGILRERKQAKAIYEAARAQGYRASLLEQHRPNVFEQKVANIEPGKSIDVDIRYFHTLAYNDGWYSFVFPTVVGPRYNPSAATDPIAPVARGTVDGRRTEAHYLRPDERSGHDVGIRVRINAGVPIEELRSTHAIDATRPSGDVAEVTLANRAAIPNRDFVLDFRVAGDTVRSNLVTWQDPETQQGYFSLLLYPPAGQEALARSPMEMVFVLDASGSMAGTPLLQAKYAVAAALDQLGPGDTFQIIRFSDDASAFGPNPVPATAANIERARRYLADLNGTGGTQMIEGVKAALGFPHDPSRLRFVSFMTDGFIGNEQDILGAVHRQVGDSRIFSFGVGSSVNRFLLERMAQEGRGAVAYLGPQDFAPDIMNAFFSRISHPALTDIEIDWGGMAVTDVYPRRIPDLFVGRSVVVTGKYLGAPDAVGIVGRVGGRIHRDTVDGLQAVTNPNVARVWARRRIADLSDRQSWEWDPADELGRRILATALEYQLMSAYTAFVAVDATEVTDGDHGTTVHQAVPVPDGVRYETTVNGKEQLR